MKKILLVAIGFHSFCMAGEFKPLLEREQPKNLSDLEFFIKDISGHYWPKDIGTFEWLKDVLKKVKLGEEHKKECKKFIYDWWQILQKLNAKGNLSAIKLVRHIEEINSKSNLRLNDPVSFVNEVVTQVSKAMSNQENDVNAFNIAKAEAEIESLFYVEKLYELLEQIKESEKEIRFPELAKFELETKNDQDLIELLQDTYQYVLGLRFFGAPFYEMRFLRNKKTNEIIKLEKKMSEEPNSVEFCIAEILRNALFFLKATPKYFDRNALTDSPYVPYEYITKNKPHSDYAKCVEDVMRKLAAFYSPEKTYKRAEISALIYLANRKPENNLSNFDRMGPEAREKFLKRQKINLDGAFARNVISYSTYKEFLEQRWLINYVKRVRNDGVTTYTINHLYRDIAPN